MASDRWFYIEGGQRRGPVDLDQLIRLIDLHKIPSHALVWRQGLDGWLRADTVPEISIQLPPALPATVQPVTAQVPVSPPPVSLGDATPADTPGIQLASPLAPAPVSTPPDPPGLRLGRWVIGLLWLQAGLAVVTTIVVLSLPSRSTWDGLVAIDPLQGIPFIVTGALMLVSVHRMSRNLRQQGRPLSFTPGWAVACWFVPFVHLFAPYQVVKELWTVSGSGSEDAKGETLLKRWWACWFLMGVAWLGAVKSARDAQDLAVVFWLVRNALLIPAAILLIRIVREISTRQQGSRSPSGQIRPPERTTLTAPTASLSGSPPRPPLPPLPSHGAEELRPPPLPAVDHVGSATEGRPASDFQRLLPIRDEDKARAAGAFGTDAAVWGIIVLAMGLVVLIGVLMSYPNRSRSTEATSQSPTESAGASEENMGNAAVAWHSKGASLLKTGNNSEAIAAFQAAIRLTPSVAESHLGLGLALGGLKRWDEAAREYREAIRLQPGNPENHYALGVAVLSMGNEQDARQAFQQALSLKPDFEDAKRGLERLNAKSSAPSGETASEDSNPQEVPQSWSRTQPAAVTSPPRTAPGTAKVEEGSEGPRAAEELAKQCASIRFSQHYADAANCYGRALRLAPNDAAIKQACKELAAWKAETGCDF